MSVARLSQLSKTVVVAEITDQFTAWDSRHALWTHTTAHVTEVISGSAKVGSDLHVVQVGGATASVTSELSGAPKFAKGDRAVLFLEPRADKAGKQIGDQWFVVGLYQGKFEVTTSGGELVARRALLLPGVQLVGRTGIRTEPVRAINEISIPLDDLRSQVSAALEVRQ